MKMTMGEFIKEYKPLENNFSTIDKYLFESYGEEWEFVLEQDPKHIWTYADSGEEYPKDIIYPGISISNRYGYFVTELPAIVQDDFIEIITETQRKKIEKARNRRNKSKKSIFDKIINFYFRKEWRIGNDERYTISFEIGFGEIYLGFSEIYLLPTILIYRSYEGFNDIKLMWLGFKFSVGDTR